MSVVFHFMVRKELQGSRIGCHFGMASGALALQR
jgi:hypothetical protein